MPVSSSISVDPVAVVADSSLSSNFMSSSVAGRCFEIRFGYCCCTAAISGRAGFLFYFCCFLHELVWRLLLPPSFCGVSRRNKNKIE